MRDEIIDKLKDPAVLPLHIACDVVMGEHASLAGYVVLDTNPYESFGVVTQEGYWAGKGNTVRWPTTEPKTALTPNGRHMSLEAFLADVAQACGLPGWGDDAIADVDGGTWPLRDASDYFLKAAANLAFEGEPVTDVEDEEVALQALDTLPDSWKSAVSEQEWPKVLKVLSRGGRFWPIEAGKDVERTAFAKEYRTELYFEKRALAKGSQNGQTRTGSMAWVEETLADRTPMAAQYQEDFLFKACQHKPRFRSVTMLANSPMMQDISDTNHVELNAEDAAELGLSEGDKVLITVPGGTAGTGTVTLRQGVARKAFGLEFGYGHIAYGSQDMELDGEEILGAPAIGAGTHLNAMLDPTVAHAFPVADPEAGSHGRNGGFYKIEKA